jgi:predicted ribosome quality control (RQC) complex YloA/Tae2 family protein
MATLQGMSGIDTRAMVEELKVLLPLWIGKIYQFKEKSIGIRLGGEHAKYLFFLEAGKRAHLTRGFPPAPKNPTGFVMLLRKYLEGGKVLGIGQFGIERIFFFEIGKREQVFRLVIELFDEGNVILCREDGTIVMPLWHHRFRDREVVRDAPYVRTGRDCTELGVEDLARLLEGSEKELVKVLATDCMLGGAYAEEVCRMAGLEKTLPAKKADARLIHQKIMVLLGRITAQRTPVITKSGCWPLLLDAEIPLQTFSSYHQALDAYFPQEEPAKVEQRAKISREDSIRTRQLRAIASFEEKSDSIRRKIDALYLHYHLVEEILRTLRDARSRHSWQEITRILRESSHAGARRIVEVYPDESAVELDLGEKVKIYVADSVEKNAARYHEQMKKLKKKTEGATAAMEKPLLAKPKERKRTGVSRPRWYHRFRWFYTTDRVLVLGGKDAGQNEELVKKYLEGGDRFFHADVHGASVIVVKGHTVHPEEAAQAAVSYSGAWRSGQFSGDAYAVEPEQVSKSAPSGEFLGRGAFMVRGERTYFRNIPLGIAIGLQVEPEMRIIGGPPATVAEQASIWVGLQPGRFEQNDIAKKVVRILKEKAHSKGIGGVQRIVTTEAVAAFIPPGGSDIVGEHEG